MAELGGRGFLAGAAGGLVLALLLVGGASYLPHQGTASQSFGPEAAAATNSSVSASSSTSSPAPATQAATSSSSKVTSQTTSPTSSSNAAQGVGSGVPALASTSTSSAAGTAAAPTVTTTTLTCSAGQPLTSYCAPPPSGQHATYGGGNGTGANSTLNVALSSGESVGSLQRPSSLLAVLPGEGVGSLLATISPLLLGLFVAVLVYGAYSRRQDSSS